MGHVPMDHGVHPNPSSGKFSAKASGMMGLTAEMLSIQYKLTREEQDLFALRSHINASRATKSKRFAKEIVEIEGHDEEGKLILSVASHDGELQPGITIESGTSEDEVIVKTSGNLTVNMKATAVAGTSDTICLLYTSPSPRD